ncbi:MAG: hypothetical protein HYR60_30465 [Acidobacteria bacterium]|nr:hypothetical protein [Acidobacteriota bacterium]
MALNLVGVLTLAMAAPPATGPVLGMVTANGSFTLDSSRVQGNATLFEGNILETGKASSQLHWTNGGRMQLAAESRGIVYRDRLVLERGENLGNYQVEARTLRIRPEGSEAQARVSLKGPDRVLVAALSGTVRVASAGGVLVANLEAGHALELEPDQGPAAGSSTVTGCLESDSGKYVLQDEASAVRFVLQGGGVAQHVGNRVQVTGTATPSSEWANLLQVTSLKVLARKCGKGAGAKPGAAGGAAGMAAGTKAIIAGVIVAGAATGGAIAAVSGDDGGPTISPSSR